MEVFDSIGLEWYNATDLSSGGLSAYLSFEEMKEMKMMIETRPSYPSNKQTFTINHFSKDKVVRFFNIILILNEVNFDVHVVLEDSKRNFLNFLN